MNKIVEKLENIIEKYVDSLSDSPLQTIVKTLLIIWVISKIKKLIK